MEKIQKITHEIMSKEDIFEMINERLCCVLNNFEFKKIKKIHNSFIRRNPFLISIEKEVLIYNLKNNIAIDELFLIPSEYINFIKIKFPNIDIDSEISCLENNCISLSFNFEIMRN
jgi:hypothetical protein